MLRNRISLQIAVAVLLSLMAGCGPPGGGLIERTGEVARQKVVADAYRFQARFKDDGKPTTFKLDVYVTDTVLGIIGTAYLGKGALRARITEDTVEALFPTTHEYLYEPVGELLTLSECLNIVPGINWPAMMGNLPDSLGLDLEFDVDADYRKPNKPQFVVTRFDCKWRLELTYDRDKSGWRLKQLNFDDGARKRLKLARRQFRRDAEIRQSKFMLPTDPGAVRITP